MGKRELLLAVVFIVLGVGVYQVTAPPGDPSKPGFSLSRLINEARREIRGRQESAEETRRSIIPAPSTVTELRIVLRTAPMTIRGEDREDIEVEFFVRSNGHDKAEAEQLLKASQLLVDQAGPMVILRGEFPVPGEQSARLTLKVPRRLAVRIDEKLATLTVDGIAGLTIGSGSGETTITNVEHQVAVVQRGRVISVDRVGALRLNASAGAEAKLANIAGDVNLTLQSVEVTASGLSGGLEVEARNSELRFDDARTLRGNIRFNLNDGELTLTGLATEARIDGRRSEIRVTMAAAVPLAIYNDGEPIEVSLPPAGVRVDAAARNARVSLDAELQQAGLKVDVPAQSETGQAREERVFGGIRGGGPMLTLRNTGADIVLRGAETSTVERPAAK